MNHTDYTSLTAMIAAIKAQISSLETILASIANQKSPKKKENVRAASVDDDDYLLTDDEENRLDEYMKKCREEEIARMAAKADEFFQKTAEEVINEE